MDLGSIVAHLQLDISNFNNALNEAREEIQNTSADMSGLESVGSSLQAVGAGLTAAVTVPVVAFGKSAVEATTTFNESMSKTGALMGATKDEMNQLRDAAKEYGATTQYSATECSDALGYMALAGWDANQSVSALPGVLNMAAASGMDLAAASDLVTDYLSAFGMEASQAGEMSDVLAYAQAKSNTTTEALGNAFKNCAANAHAAGLDLQTTTALLGQLANQGLKGSEAGTALNAVMRDMTAKMKDGAISIGDTKVQVQDANGNYRDMIDILADVESATDGMGDAERASALQATFTADSIKGLNLLLNAGTDSASDFRDSLYDCSGTAEEMADKMNDNLSGDIKECESAFESMQLAVGEKLDPVLRAIVQTITKVFNAFGKLPAPVLQVIMVLAGILAVVGPIILILGTFMTKLREVKDGLRMLKAAFNIIKEANLATRVINIFETALGGVRGIIMNSVVPALQSLWAFMLANPITIVIVAILALIGIFTTLWNHCEGFRNLWENLIDNIIEKAYQISPAFGTLVKGVINVIEGFVNIIQALFGGIVDIIKDVFSGDFDKIGEDFSKMGDKISGAFGTIVSGLQRIGKNAIDGLYDVFINGLNKLFDPIINWGYSINGHIGDAFVDLYGIARDYLKLVKDYFKDTFKIIGDILKGDWKGAFNDIGNLFKHLGANIKNIAGDIIMAVGDLMLGIKQAISDKASEIWNGITTWISNTFNNIVNSISSWFNNLVNTIQTNAVNIMNTVINFLSELPGKIAYGLGYALGTIIRWSIELKDKVTETAKNAVDSFVEFWTTLPERLSTWLTNTISNIQTWGNNVKQEAIKTGTYFINNIVNWFQTLPNRIYTWLQNALNNISNWAINVKNKAIQAGTNMVNNFINYVRSLPSKLWNLLLQAINRVTTFASNMLQKGRQAGRDFLNSVVNGVKSLPSKLKQVGVNAINGLINGLKSGATRLWNAAQDLANKALQGMKDALKINSPSKKFRDIIGKSIPEGVAVGIKVNAKSAYDTVKTFADNLVEFTRLPDIATGMNINSGGVISNTYLQNTSTIEMLKEVKQAIVDSKTAIDYDKMTDAFTQGAKKVDSTIYMDREVVGKIVSEPVRSINKLVSDRLNRLEGV